MADGCNDTCSYRDILPCLSNILIVTLDRQRGATRATGQEPLTGDNPGYLDTPAVATGEVAFYWIYILFRLLRLTP